MNCTNCKNCGAPIKNSNSMVIVCAYCKTRYEPERQVRKNIDTGDGVYVGGNLTVGGDFVGRNKTVVVVNKR